MFNPGGFTGRFRVCPFLGTWRALLCGDVSVKALDEAAAFSGGNMTRSHLVGRGQVNRLRQTYSGRLLFLRSG